MYSAFVLVGQQNVSAPNTQMLAPWTLLSGTLWQCCAWVSKTLPTSFAVNHRILPLLHRAYFTDPRLNKWLGKQWWGWWFETQSRPSWRHWNGQTIQVTQVVEHNNPFHDYGWVQFLFTGHFCTQPRWSNTWNTSSSFRISGIFYPVYCMKSF